MYEMSNPAPQRARETSVRSRAGQRSPCPFAREDSAAANVIASRHPWVAGIE